jgi:hypothetical protein
MGKLTMKNRDISANIALVNWWLALNINIFPKSPKKSLTVMFSSSAVCYTDFWEAYYSIVPSKIHKSFDKMPVRSIVLKG